MSPTSKNQIFCEDTRINFIVPLSGVTRPFEWMLLWQHIESLELDQQSHVSVTLRCSHTFLYGSSQPLHQPFDISPLSATAENIAGQQICQGSGSATHGR